MQLSSLQLFRRFSVKSEPASVSSGSSSSSSSEQPPSLLKVHVGSILKAAQQTGGAWMAIISTSVPLNVVRGKFGLEWLKGKCMPWFCGLRRRYVCWPQNRSPFWEVGLKNLFFSIFQDKIVLGDFAHLSLDENGWVWVYISRHYYFPRRLTLRGSYDKGRTVSPMFL